MCVCERERGGVHACLHVQCHACVCERERERHRESDRERVGAFLINQTPFCVLECAVCVLAFCFQTLA